MEDLQCKGCQENFDLEAHLPQIIPSSKLTVCKSCVRRNFQTEAFTGQCPVTGQPFE